MSRYFLSATDSNLTAFLIAFFQRKTFIFILNIFLKDGLYNLKDLLIPSLDELPPCEMLDTFANKSKDEDIKRLEKQIKGETINQRGIF